MSDGESLRMLMSIASRLPATFVTCFALVARKMNCVSVVRLVFVACSIEKWVDRMASASSRSLQNEASLSAAMRWALACFSFTTSSAAVMTGGATCCCRRRA